MRSLYTSESLEQQGFIQWFRLRFPEVLIFHIPNGGVRHIVTAARLQKEGVVPGIPDLYIPEWRLWIEMKRASGGILSDDQERIIKYLDEIGHTVIIGYGATDASIKVLEFLKPKL